MQNIRDFDNLAAEELEYVLQYLKRILEIPEKYFYKIQINSEDKRENQAILRALSEQNSDPDKHPANDKMILIEMDGLESRQLEQLFDYVGIERAVNRDMGNKSCLIAVYSSDMPKLKETVEKLSNGEISWEEVFPKSKEEMSQEYEREENEEQDERESGEENEEQDERESGEEHEFSNEEETIDADLEEAIDTNTEFDFSDDSSDIQIVDGQIVTGKAPIFPAFTNQEEMNDYENVGFEQEKEITYDDINKGARDEWDDETNPSFFENEENIEDDSFFDERAENSADSGDNKLESVPVKDSAFLTEEEEEARYYEEISQNSNIEESHFIDNNNESYTSATLENSSDVMEPVSSENETVYIDAKEDTERGPKSINEQDSISANSEIETESSPEQNRTVIHNDSPQTITDLKEELESMKNNYSDNHYSEVESPQKSESHFSDNETNEGISQNSDYASAGKQTDSGKDSVSGYNFSKNDASGNYSETKENYHTDTKTTAETVETAQTAYENTEFKKPTDSNSTYQKNYEAEKQMQRDIVERNASRQQKPEDVHVNKVGDATDYTKTVTEANHYSESKEIQEKAAQTEKEKREEHEIHLYETRLLNNHLHDKNTDLLEQTGDSMTGIAKQAKSTETYHGFTSTKQPLLPVEVLALNRSRENAASLHYDMLLMAEQDKKLDSLNKMLENKHVEGTFDRDKTGLLKNGITFRTEDSARVSEVAIMHMLEKKGLVVQNQKGADASWNTLRFMKLYNGKKYEELARILQISDSITWDMKKEIIDNLGAITISMNARNNVAKKNEKVKKGMLRSISKKTIQDTATFSGVSDVVSVVTVVRQSYRMAKMTARLGGKAFHRPAAYVNKTVIRPAMMSSELGNKILNKETSVQQAYIHHKSQKTQKALDKDYHVSKMSREGKVKAIERGPSQRRQTRIDKLKKKQDDLAKLRNARFDKKIPFAKTINKIGGVKDKVASTLAKKGLLGSIFNIFNKFKLYIAIVLGVFLLVCCIIEGAASILISVTAFFNSEEGTPSDVYTSSAGKTLDKLLNMETKWVQGLQNIQDNDNIRLDSLKYSRDYVPFASYLSAKGFGYDPNTGEGLGPDTLFGLPDVPNEMRKHIDKIDGGVELEYQNASGGATRTSNLKEILSMCNVYFDHTYDLDNFSKAAFLSIAQDKNTMPQLKKATNVMQDWITTVDVSDENSVKPSKVMEQYCSILFAVSHQEIFDLELVTLPTKNMLPEDISEEEIEGMDLCTEDDGCMSYHGFVYNAGKPSLLTQNESGESTFTDVSSWVTMKDQYDDFVKQYPESFFAVYPQCWSDDCSRDGTIAEFEASVLSHPECWNVTFTSNDYTQEITSTGPAKSPSVDDYASALSSEFMKYVGAICTSNGHGMKYCDVSKLKTGVFEVQYDDTEYTFKNSSGEFSVSTNFYMTFTHNCKGHEGSYCGGHYKMRVTGQVYGFTDEQIAEGNGEADGEIIGKIGNGEYSIVNTTSTLVDTNKLSTMQDIFDADSAIFRPVVSEDWNGWTEDNMSLAVLKYSQDWEEMYGVTISSALGGSPLSNADKKLIMEQIDERYPGLSQERRNIVLTALDKVGCMGYSQNHHNCTFEGPCTVNPNGACIFSDCSGFASNLWKDRFGGQIYGTGTFYSTFKGTSKWSGFSADDMLPGDILLHYGGGGPGGGDDHALVWLGDIQYNFNVQTYLTIDCSTVDGVGNVYLRHRDYYNSCYVVHPDR